MTSEGSALPGLHHQGQAGPDGAPRFEHMNSFTSALDL